MRFKGMILQIFQDHLRALLERGEIGPDERSLSPLLEAEIAGASWYPLQQLLDWCDQIAQLVGSDEEGLREFGRGAALKAERDGPYEQLKVSAANQGFDLAIRLVVTVGKLLHEYMEWKFLECSLEEGFIVQATGAAGWSETLLQITTGWIEHMFCSLYGRPMRVESERPEPDRLLFIGRPV